MKRLTLIRHGKSSWKYELPDHDRPLKKRATSDAALVIGALRSQLEDRTPTLWSSSAKRALDTASMFKEQLNIGDSSFFVKRELYTFDSEELESVIRTCDDQIDDLMVFGHNPAITEFVEELGTQSFANIPTTGLVAMEFDSPTWTDIYRGRTSFHLFPKNLR